MGEKVSQFLTMMTVIRDIVVFALNLENLSFDVHWVVFAYSALCCCLCSDAITKVDIKVFATVPSKPDTEFPNVAGWYETISAAVASRFDLFHWLQIFKFSRLMSFTGCRFRFDLFHCLQIANM